MSEAFRNPTVCDTDEAKQNLLVAAVEKAQAKTENLGDVLQVALAVRKKLPKGLAHDDFDGANVQAVLDAQAEPERKA